MTHGDENKTLQPLLLQNNFNMSENGQCGFNAESVMHGLFKETILGSERRLCWLVMWIINTHIWKIRAKVATEQFKGAVSCFFSLFNRKNEFYIYEFTLISV